MYESLRGRITAVDSGGHCSIEVGGVGYALRVSEQTRHALPLDGSEVLVYTRLIVREDDLILFGFHDPAERSAFDLLTSVQGIGPVAALAICSALPVDALHRALQEKDVAAFKRVKGVGAKSAERIALELHDQVERIPLTIPVGASAPPPADAAREEARRALVVLGFAPREVDKALEAVAAADLAREELVRLALAHLR